MWAGRSSLSRSAARSESGSFSRLAYWGVESRREVHWYHDFRPGGGYRDKYEVYNKDANAEFGQSAITDKDRYPQLYWSIWKGRTTIKRVIDQFGYSKDLKPEKLKYEVEKLKHFKQLDSLNFLEFSRSTYQYLDDDARGAVGYITDDEIDELREHADFGKMYCDAAPEYRTEVLRDPCGGRPVYEWQVPYGLDEAHGYKDVSTAVDILGNEEAMSNTSFDWRVTSAHETTQGAILKHPTRNQELIIVDEEHAAGLIKDWKPDTVIFQRGAEQILSSAKRAFAATNPTDKQAAFLALSWSAAMYITPFWPTSSAMQVLTTAGLLGMNGMIFKNVFLANQGWKKSMGACRETQCDIVLGDWLADDYVERMHHISAFDDLALRTTNPSRSRELYAKAITYSREEDYWYRRAWKAFLSMKVFEPEQPHPVLKSDDVVAPNWMRTYKDAVNERRVDILAHVANNVEGDRIVVALRNCDNILFPAARDMVEQRLTGKYGITPEHPLRFDPYYERVEVAF